MRNARLLFIVVALALVFSALPAQTVFAQEETPTWIGVVQTEAGRMVGVRGESDGVTLFKGVPYAAPPVGDLRWAPPQDPDSWSGIRAMNSYSDACMQYTFDGDMNAEPWKSDFYYVELPALSEDCLYLNVATSATAGDEAMPVFVWFHGGGLRHGYSSEVEFNPDVLADKGIIVVTVGTRLGIYGYMALPQLSEESGYGASGNYGLMDEVKALEWIRDNIAAFGGDPSNVTVGGQSGGASKSAGLFVTKQADDLAHRLIMQSGLQLTGSYAPLETAEERGVAWLQHLGLTGEESLEELRAADAQFFMGGVYPEYQRLAPASMNYDGEYITYATQKEAWDAGELEGVDIIVGSNLGEANYDPNIKDTATFNASYEELLGDLYTEYDFPNLVSVVNADAADLARTLASYGFTTQASRNLTLSQLFGAYHSANNEEGDVYVYLFTHRPPGRDEDTMWAWHSGEMWYTFASLRDIPEQRDWEEVDYELADTMSSMWANFIATGDPNGEGLPTWTPSTSDSLAYMEFGDEIYLDTELNTLEQLMVDWVKAQFELE